MNDTMALPLKKRAYRGNDLIAKRLKRVERQARLNRPEMKSNELSNGPVALATGALNAHHLCAINQGAGSDERLGLKAKLFRLEIRGMADPSLDIYLIQSKNATAPTVTDFSANVGGYIVDGRDSTFVEWRYLRLKPDQIADVPFRITQSFKTGFNLEFNTSTSLTTRNTLYLVVRNNSGASQNYTYSVKRWFTDA